jgi:hypothetical protein
VQLQFPGCDALSYFYCNSCMVSHPAPPVLSSLGIPCLMLARFGRFESACLNMVAVHVDERMGKEIALGWTCSIAVTGLTGACAHIGSLSYRHTPLPKLSCGPHQIYQVLIMLENGVDSEFLEVLVQLSLVSAHVEACDCSADNGTKHQARPLQLRCHWQACAVWRSGLDVAV